MSDVPIDPIGAARRLDTILGRADLPYTNTDEDGDTLLIASGLIEMHKGNRVASMRVPTGEDAAAFARAVLAAAGDTGHEVISAKELGRMRRTMMESSAAIMRERAAIAATDNTTDDYDIRRAIRALPLTPDGAEVAHSGCSQERSETPSEQPAVHVATPEGITPCGAGHHDVTTAALIAEVTCVGCLQALALEKGGQVVEMRNERDRLRTAWVSARHRARLFLDRATEARAQLDEARRWGRILEAQRADLRQELRAESARVSQARDERDQALQAARSTRDRIAEWLEECGSAWEGAHVRAMTLLPASSDQTGDALPAEDLVEPGDEVTDLAELHELVERLALDLSETTKAVTQRLAVVEGRLGITDEDTTDEAPTRYRDRDGDLWEQDADNPDRYILTQWRDGSSVGHQLTRTLDALRDVYGPLTPVTT